VSLAPNAADAKAPIALRSMAKAWGYRVKLTPQVRDYWLSSPKQPGTYIIEADATRAAPKNKLVFDKPLAPGAYVLDIRMQTKDSSSTLVLSVPVVSGKYIFTISTVGQARYDLAFHNDGPTKEYRFTLNGPVQGQTFNLDMPKPQAR
jgi:hypothetical protein